MYHLAAVDRQLPVDAFSPAKRLETGPDAGDSQENPLEVDDSGTTGSESVLDPNEVVTEEDAASVEAILGDPDRNGMRQYFSNSMKLNNTNTYCNLDDFPEVPVHQHPPPPPPIHRNYNGHLLGEPGEVPRYIKEFSGGRVVWVAVEGTFRFEDLVYYKDERGEFVKFRE